MERVKDYNEFFRQLSKFKKENATTYTNFFLFGSKLKNIISQGKLYAEQTNGAFVICEDEGGYFQFYYCVNAMAKIPLAFTDKTCASWLIYNEKTSAEEVQAQKDKLLQAGFRYVVRNIQYTMDIGKKADSIKAKLALQSKKAADRGITLRFMEKEDYKDLDALWRQCFDAFRIPDISKDLSELTADKRILLACKDMSSGEVASKRKIVGSRFMDFQGKTVHTHKTCVDSECRGAGVGKLLVLAGLDEALKRGCTRWLVEVDEGNTASEQMHIGALGEQPERSGVIAEMFVKSDHDS